MSVTGAPRRASGPPASPPGSRPPARLDLALVVNDGPDARRRRRLHPNRVKAAPVLWTQQVLTAGAAARRRAQLRRRQRLHRARRASRTPTPPPSTSRPRCAAGGTAIGAVEVAVCSTGLIGERLPMDKLLAGVDRGRARAGRRPDGGDAAAASAIMTTDTVPKTGCAAPATAGPSAAWPRARACSRPALATMLVRAHHRRGRRRRRAGRGAARGHRASPSTGSTPTAACPPTTPCCCWPPAPAASRRRQDELDRGGHRGLRRPGAAAAGRRRGRHQGDRDRRSTRRRHRGRRGRGRPGGRPRQPGQDRAVRRRPQLGPGAGRGRHDAGAASSPTRSTSRSTASGSAVDGAARRATARRSTCPARTSPSTIDLGAGDGTADDLDQRPVPRLRRRELGVLAHDRARAPDLAPRRARRHVLIEALPWLEQLRTARSSWSSTAATR